MAIADLTQLGVEQPLMPAAAELIPKQVTVVQIQAPPHPPYADLAPLQAVIAGSQYYGAELMDAAPRLRIIARAGIGLDSVDIDAATTRGIIVCNTPDGPTESTAEHTVAMLLALAKRIKEGDANMAGGAFASSRALTGSEVYGKRLGIIGMGRIGRRVAEICRQGLHMRVLAYSRSLTAPQAAELGVAPADIDTVIAEADFLTLHLPLTPETRNILSSERIARMKPGAYLLNLSRGALVDSQALLAAVDSGRLAGAGLDVFEPEPPPPDSPLRRHPRILVTPHIGSSTVEGRTRMEATALQQVLAWFGGQQPPHIVNPEALHVKR